MMALGPEGETGQGHNPDGQSWAEGQCGAESQGSLSRTTLEEEHAVARSEQSRLGVLLTPRWPSATGTCRAGSTEPTEHLTTQVGRRPHCKRWIPFCPEEARYSLCSPSAPSASPLQPHCHLTRKASSWFLALPRPCS